MHENVYTALSIFGGITTVLSEGVLMTLSATVTIVCGVIAITKTVIRVVDTIRKYASKKITAKEACEELDEAKEVFDNDIQRMD